MVNTGKRSAGRDELLQDAKIVLLDIEGTTTSISFVKDTLFPYVRENLKKYVDEKWDSEDFKDDYEKLKEQAKIDEENKVESVIKILDESENLEEKKESLIKNVLWQMDNDRKTTALKQLQGHMWNEAYVSGTIKGHVYEDVPKAFEEWTKKGKKIYIYSSGSVKAQKLLFGHSEHGDLLKYISGHFDTEVGPKQEAQSYKDIAKKIGEEPSSILFFTDIVKEAEAAIATGLSAAITLREGNAPLTDEEKKSFTLLDSLLDLSCEASCKRQKLEDDNEKNKQETIEVTSSSEISTAAAEPMDTSEQEKVTEEKSEVKKEDEKKPETMTNGQVKSNESAAVKDDAEVKMTPKVPEEKVTENKKTENEEKKQEEMETEQNQVDSKSVDTIEVTKEDDVKCEKENKKVDNETELKDKKMEDVDSEKKPVGESVQKQKESSDVEMKSADSESISKDEKISKKHTESEKTEILEKAEPKAEVAALENKKSVETDKAENNVEKNKEDTKVDNDVKKDQILESEKEIKKAETVDNEVKENGTTKEQDSKEEAESKSTIEKQKELTNSSGTEKPDILKEVTDEKTTVTEEVDSKVNKSENSDAKVEKKSDEVTVKDKIEVTKPEEKNVQDKIEDKISNSKADDKCAQEKTEVDQPKEVAQKENIKPPASEKQEEQSKESNSIVEKDKIIVPEISPEDKVMNGSATNGNSKLDEEKVLNGSEEVKKAEEKTEVVQNGKTEESITETIKLKKADAIADPETVTPPVVAATS